MKTMWKTLIVCIVVLVLGGYCFAANDAPTFDAALEKLANYKDRSEVEAAMEGFEDIKSDYGNVSMFRMYAEAILSIHDGSYEDAIRILNLLANNGVFSDQLKQYNENLYLPSCEELVKYCTARMCEDQGDYLTALTLYEEVSGIWDSFSRYLDTDKKLGDYRESEYQRAEQLLEGGNYEEASEIFQKLGTYKDSEQRYELAMEPIWTEERYNLGQQQLEAGNYWGAAETFGELGDYKDSIELHNNAIAKAEAEETAEEMNTRYTDGLQKLQSGDYAGAAEIFGSLGDYKDSIEQYNNAIAMMEEEAAETPEPISEPMQDYQTLSKGDKGDAVLQLQHELIERDFLYDTADGIFGSKTEAAIRTVQEQAGLPITGIADPETYKAIMSMHRDVIADAHKWGKAWSIDGEMALTVALKRDGTVVAAGHDLTTQDFAEWQDIVSVFALGPSCVMGIRSDGTINAAGYEGVYENNAEIVNRKDVVAVSAGPLNRVALKSDGSTIVLGNNEHGQLKAAEWKDIVAIDASGDKNIIGLKRDGTVVAAGWNDSGKCNVSGWHDIVKIAAGDSHTVGLMKDGTVVAVGWNGDGACNVSDWSDIIAISAGLRHTVGLKNDGTVVAVGDNSYGQCDVTNWTDIVAITTGPFHTIGLKSDGTVVVVGGDNCGYTEHLDVSDWTDLMLP